MNGGGIFALVFIILIIIGLVIGGIVFWIHEENKNKKPVEGGGGTGPTGPTGPPPVPGTTGIDFSFKSSGTNFYSSQLTIPPNSSNSEAISGSFLANISNVTPTCKSSIFTFNTFTRNDGSTISNAIVWKDDPSKILCYSLVSLGAYALIDNPDKPSLLYPDFFNNPTPIGPIPSNNCSWKYDDTTKNICLSDNSRCLVKEPVDANENQLVLVGTDTSNPLYKWDITSPISSPLCS